MKYEQDNFNFYLFKKQENPLNISHFHERYEIWYCLKGETQFFIHDKTYNIFKGNIILINKNTLHKILIDKEKIKQNERFVVEFNESFLTEGNLKIEQMEKLLFCFNQQRYVLNLDAAVRTEIEKNFFKIMEQYTDKKIHFKMYMRILLIETLIVLNRIVKNTIPDREKDLSLSEQKIQEAVKYINENYNQDISLEQIARKHSISKYYFCRIFKNITGFNFVDYLNHVRINEAQKLILNSNLNVSNIAEKVGYNNVVHFSRMFKKIIGCPPSKY